MEEQYPSNSNKDQTEKTTPISKKVSPKSSDEVTSKKVEQITINTVVRRKKPWHKRFSESFMGNNAQSVGNYIVIDVLLPAAKDMVADAVSQGIEKMLFGDSHTPRARSTGNRGTGGNASYVSYNRYSGNSQNSRTGPKPISQRARANHDFDEIVLATRAEAEEVVDHLYSLVDNYEVATVADLYGMVGQTGSYTDEKWGWNDLRGTSISRVKGGYLLDLPRPQYLD